MRMMIFLVSLAALAPAVQAQEGQRPMNEMHGDCANYRWHMAREMALWSATAQDVRLSATPAAGSPTMTAERKYQVLLVAHPTVTFAAKPEQDRGGPDRYSGLARFSVPSDGLYRISAGSGLWIDVVENGRLVKSEQFEMQTKCTTIFKSVAFRLKAGIVYWLQLNGNRTTAVGVLLTPVAR